MASLLGQRLLKSAVLVGIFVILAVLIAVPIGMLQAVRRNKFTDRFNTFSTIFYAMPSFFLLGLLLILIFAIKSPIFPAEAPQGETLGAILSNFDRDDPADRDAHVDHASPCSAGTCAPRCWTT